MKKAVHTLVSQVGNVTSYAIHFVEVPVEDEVHGTPEPVITEHVFGDGDKGWLVSFDWSKVANVTRPSTGGIATGSGAKGLRLAERLAAATRAGRVHYDAFITTDVQGGTYVQSSTRVMGKYLNADLRRLGF